MALVSQLTQWQALAEHAQARTSFDLSALFTKDKQRADKFSLQVGGIFLDYSKQQITSETKQLLLELAQAQDLSNKIEALFSGEIVNSTEQRAALHTALRQQEQAMSEVVTARQRMKEFTDSVREQRWLGSQGLPITNVVNIGIGGSDLGPRLVLEALESYHDTELTFHFVSNIDPHALMSVLQRVDPATTLFIVTSKTFTTTETLHNAQTAKHWLQSHLGSEMDLAAQFIAVTEQSSRAKDWGIAEDNIFPLWDWLGGRYSLWSCVGLPIALAIGMEKFNELLQGAEQMDKHFRQAPLDKNMPVILGLLAVWNTNFCQRNNHAILPYSHSLQLLPRYLQQLEMESLGKQVNNDGDFIDYVSGPIIWGGVGCDGQHAFHQLLHQGTVSCAVDFIASVNSSVDADLHQDYLLANCFSQALAFMQGNQASVTYKKVSGNKVSNMLLLEALSPENLGTLLALYEHKVFVHAVLLDINPFDQWGVELGKQVSQTLLPYLQVEKIPEQFDSSTQNLIKRCHQWRRK